MKASKQNAASIFVYMLLSAGVLSWSLFSFHGIDLVSEPFGSMMVLSRTILALAVLAVAQEFVRRRAALARQTVRVRTRGRHG
jgi:uncharacterized membrane protein YuzA (DUF378 family)